MTPTADEHFGLVSEAPAWLVWRLEPKGWCCIAGADTAKAAIALARRIGGTVRPRGDVPNGLGVVDLSIAVRRRVSR